MGWAPSIGPCWRRAERVAAGARDGRHGPTLCLLSLWLLCDDPLAVIGRHGKGVRHAVVAVARRRKRMTPEQAAVVRAARRVDEAVGGFRGEQRDWTLLMGRLRALHEALRTLDEAKPDGES